MSDQIKYPHWNIGNWWIIAVRQLAVWMKTSEARWVGPFRMRFELIKENDESFILNVTYPYISKRSDSQRAEVSISKRDFNFIKGTLHIGENEIPMRYDFIAKLLTDHPPGVNTSGQQEEAEILLGPEEKFGPALILTTFSYRTATGGIQISALELPYHLHIVEENYTIDLESWGSKAV